MTKVTTKEWLEFQKNDANGIKAAIAEWALDAFEHDAEGFTLKNVISHLETTNCAGCHAPSGLIYNHEIARKAADWYVEIDDAIDAYRDATGENPSPWNGALSLGWLVWFAVEWEAQEMARLIESNCEDGTITEKRVEGE